MSASKVPAGYHTVTPYLMVSSAAKAIEFYKKALGATELMRLSDPSGGVGHAEIKVGDSPIMLADDSPHAQCQSPGIRGGSTVGIALYVEDADALYARAVAAGAKPLCPMTDQFYGDRSGTVEDPFGHVWTLATHIEDVPTEEIERRYAAMMQS